MKIVLPAPVAAFYEADRTDGDAVARCFTQTPIVIDEGNTYDTPQAIARWRNEAATQFEYTVEPRHMERSGDAVLVVATVAGNFPGSPVDLSYAFVLDGDRIARLEITQ